MCLFQLMMLRQIQNVLNEINDNHHHDILKLTQNLILNALQTIFPPQCDFQQLAQFYNNPDIANNPPLLTYHLVNYFIQIVAANFVSIHSYSSLETQTQKLESAVRSHIKLQQEVKMYLEHLESKISKYQTYINHYIRKQKQQSPPKDHENLPSSKQTYLLKERLALIRKNDHLERNLKQKEEELRKYSEMNSEHKGLIQNFIQKDKLILSKSEHRLLNFRSLSECKSQDSPKMENRSLNKLKSPISEQNGSVLITINGSKNLAQSHNRI